VCIQSKCAQSVICHVVCYAQPQNATIVHSAAQGIGIGCCISNTLICRKVFQCSAMTVHVARSMNPQTVEYIQWVHQICLMVCPFLLIRTSTAMSMHCGTFPHVGASYIQHHTAIHCLVKFTMATVAKFCNVICQWLCKMRLFALIFQPFWAQ